MPSLPRHISALALIVLYAMITMSPLASLAMRSATVAHAITGECAGDCIICNCSPERSANHTCCCWQKKLHKNSDREETQEQSDCCEQNQESHSDAVVMTSSPPCNSGKNIAVGGYGLVDVLPYRFSQGIPIIRESSLVEHPLAHLTNWSGIPPDPPPKLSRLS